MFLQVFFKMPDTIGPVIDKIEDIVHVDIDTMSAPTIEGEYWYFSVDVAFTVECLTALLRSNEYNHEVLAINNTNSTFLVRAGNEVIQMIAMLSYRDSRMKVTVSPSMSWSTD